MQYRQIEMFNMEVKTITRSQCDIAVPLHAIKCNHNDNSKELPILNLTFLFMTLRNKSESDKIHHNFVLHIDDNMKITNDSHNGWNFFNIIVFI